ncbi:hypothetical protein [Legionella erythra]|uniref:Uncharacterized protein n=1 Tax=Legionella erythra TaxID=448 RepID=A0A0W0TGJ3_LEGER|nr:hypothetical protein [Legionella erythra]KTC94678.1 hypothetical protein Lery_2845 [Legionella erythra]
MAGLNKESLKEWKKSHQSSRPENQDLVKGPPRDIDTRDERVGEYNSLADGDFETFHPDPDSDSD